MAEQRSDPRAAARPVASEHATRSREERHYGIGARALGWLRLVLRLPLAVLGTALLALVWFALLPFAARSPGGRMRLRAFVFRSWARLCLACAAIEVAVEGRPPEPPCFLVANHFGYVDVWVLAAQSNCVFVSMAEVLRWPFVGLMARSLGTIFLDRQNKRAIPAANRAIEDALACGSTVVLFPEGTGSPGADVAPFRPALLEAAVRTTARIAYATLRYETAPGDRPASRSIAWMQTPFFTHLATCFQNRRVRATLIYGDEPVRARDRKALAAELHAKVSRRFSHRKQSTTASNSEPVTHTASSPPRSPHARP